MSRAAGPATLAIGEVSGAAELVGAIVDRIADGALADGDRLPSTRALAQQTGLSRGTVVRAFDELAAAGFVSSEHGSGTRVSRGAAQAARAGARTRGSEGSAGEASSSSPLPEPRRGHSSRDLRPGTPDAALVDDRAWRAAVRAAAAQGLAGLNPWEEPSPTLRAALAGHLRRHRGIGGADPLLFDSSRSAIAALCAAFVAARGAGVVASDRRERGDPLARGRGAGSDRGRAAARVAALDPRDVKLCAQEGSVARIPLR